MHKKFPTANPSHHLAFAACSMELTGSNEMQLTPAGRFSARDGRPVECGSWYIDAALAAPIIAAADAQVTPFVADYDHQTLRAKTNGQPAPAAGWFKKLEWREGVGLFAVDVAWTERAKGLIESGEYKFVSPVIAYDKVTGNVTGLFMAAITNYPAIDGMDKVMLAAAALHFSFTPLTKESSMNIEELLQQVRWLLNLPLTATPENVQAELQKLIDLIKQDSTATAAASFDLIKYIADQRKAVADLSGATPDPAKYVTVEVMTQMQQQFAALSAQVNGGKVDEIVKAAIAEGKLLPAQEAWARDLGGKDIAALTGFIASAPKIPLLDGPQSDEIRQPGGPGAAALTAAEQALCEAFGITAEQFRANSAQPA